MDFYESLRFLLFDAFGNGFKVRFLARVYEQIDKRYTLILFDDLVMCDSVSQNLKKRVSCLLFKVLSLLTTL